MDTALRTACEELSYADFVLVKAVEPVPSKLRAEWTEEDCASYIDALPKNRRGGKWGLLATHGGTSLYVCYTVPQGEHGGFNCSDRDGDPFGEKYRRAVEGICEWDGTVVPWGET